jgi:hypothetical protein
LRSNQAQSLADSPVTAPLMRATPSFQPAKTYKQINTNLSKSRLGQATPVDKKIHTTNPTAKMTVPRKHWDVAARFASMKQIRDINTQVDMLRKSIRNDLLPKRGKSAAN